MFEIYRESDYNRAYHYIFYTELEEHAREREISRAAAGVSVLSGFLANASLDAARAEVERIIDELNELDRDNPTRGGDTLRERLAEYLVEA